jgi:hypothetical protein
MPYSAGMRDEIVFQHRSITRLKSWVKDLPPSVKAQLKRAAIRSI